MASIIFQKVNFVTQTGKHRQKLPLHTWLLDTGLCFSNNLIVYWTDTFYESNYKHQKLVQEKLLSKHRVKQTKFLSVDYQACDSFYATRYIYYGNDKLNVAGFLVK